jgi:heme exporter protein D
MSEFLAMGGYAFYVWTAYAIAFVVLLANLIWPMVRQRQIQRLITRTARLPENKLPVSDD